VRQQGWEISIDIHADGFLYHMVRNVVGNLVQVGTGKWDADYIAELMQKRDRAIGAATAPAQGLYFSDALYPSFSARELIGKETN